jgi:AcrR family transcriptional regulator
VLRATGELLHENGYDALTIGAIAARAGVGRQTIYRWWASTSSIVSEAIREDVVALTVPDVPPRAGETAIGTWLRQYAAIVSEPRNAALIRALAAAAAEDEAEFAALYRRLTGPAHDELVGLLREAPRRRASAETLADAIVGAVLYRVLTRAEVSEAFVAELGSLDAPG